MFAADEFPTAGIVELPALLLAFHTPGTALIVRALSAGHTQASGFELRIPFFFTSGVAGFDVSLCHFRILTVSGAVGLEVAEAEELTIVEFHGLHPTEAVPKAHKATATRWGNSAIQQAAARNPLERLLLIRSHRGRVAWARSLAGESTRWLIQQQFAPSV
jgi:hypothetical protein